MIVMKFGGTSVKDRDAILRVTEIVRGRMADRPLVVVSALSQVTRVLCNIAEVAETQCAEKAESLLAPLRERHLSLATELLSADEKVLGQCLGDLNAICDSLSDFVHGVCCIGELSPRSYARIVSTGELLSSKIVSAAMNVNGLRCGWVDARKMIVTDCQYMSAVPDLEATQAGVRRIVPEAAKGVDVVLTQGFIASSVEGAPSVLGFEGSDYTAAILGMALDAERVEIWTDVDGIRTADPRKVDVTARVEKISYEEASEMAFLGARVLHPLTIEPARKKNIPVYVLDSLNPDSPGSVVTYEQTACGPKTIAVKEDIDFLEITSRNIVGVSSMLAGVFSCIADYPVKTVLVSSSESKVGLTLESGQPGFEELLSSLRNRFCVMVYRDKAEISVVGRNVVSQPGVYEDVMEALDGCPVYMSVQSPSLLSTSVVIDRKYAEEAAGRLHSKLFG